MTKTELERKIESAISKGNRGLQKLWDNIPKGQRKQLLKDVEIKDTLKIYGVKYEDV